MSQMKKGGEFIFGKSLIRVDLTIDIAFTMGAKGPLPEKSESFDGDIKVY